MAWGWVSFWVWRSLCQLGNSGWGCLLTVRPPVRACAQGAEFASRVPGWRDISCEEDSHLPTLTGLSSFKNHVA